MSSHRWPRLQIEGQSVPKLSFYPRGTHHSAWFILQRIGHIHDSGAGIAHCFPVPARAVLIAGKEGEIHFLELLGTHTLDETDFVSNGLQLAKRFVVIQQLGIERREV